MPTYSDEPTLRAPPTADGMLHGRRWTLRGRDRQPMVASPRRYALLNQFVRSASRTCSGLYVVPLGPEGQSQFLELVPRKGVGVAEDAKTRLPALGLMGLSDDAEANGC